MASQGTSSSFSGMSPEVIEACARAISGEQSNLSSLLGRVDRLVESALQSWQGDDAKQLDATWRGSMRPQVIASVDLLSTMSGELSRNAVQQRQASDDNGGAPSSTLISAPNTGVGSAWAEGLFGATTGILGGIIASLNAILKLVDELIAQQVTQQAQAALEAPSKEWLDQINTDPSKPGWIEWYDAGNRDQCVDLANAYVMGGLFGYTTGTVNSDIWSGYYPYEMFDKANPEFFDKIKPGEGQPSPGDVVTFSPTATDAAGHIAVIKDVTFDSSGKATSITIIEQNSPYEGAPIRESTVGLDGVYGYLHPNYQAISDYRTAHGLTPNSPDSVAESSSW